MGYVGGVLAGIMGAGLLWVATWLGGLLLFVGYGHACYVLLEGHTRWERSLCFGFFIVAMLGLMVFIGRFFAKDMTFDVIVFLGDRHLLFPGFTVAPWAFAAMRYLASWRQARPTPYSGG